MSKIPAKEFKKNSRSESIMKRFFNKTPENIFGLFFIFTLIILGSLVFSREASATTYYIDSSITDTYIGSSTPDFTTYNPTTFATGTGTDSVYKTIADVNLKSFAPGDNIYFRKGQTWRETLTIPSSGTLGHPITFGAYGEGEKPIIDGSDSISTWSLDNLTTDTPSTYTTSIAGDFAYTTWWGGINDDMWKFGNYDGSGVQNTGIRFRNVTIPPGSTISSAYITFVPFYDSQGADIKLKLSGEKTVTPGTITTNSDFNTRSTNLTTASTTWTVSDKIGGNAFNSPEIKDVISEIIGLDGWSSGNNLVIFAMDNGSTAGNYEVIDTNYAPVLHITVSNLSSDVYSKVVTTQPNQLFLNNTRASLSRWPSVGWQNIDTTSNNFTSLQSNLLSQADNYWVGSRAVVRDSNWDIADRAITGSSQSANTISWTTPTNSYPKAGYGFYIENNPYIISTAGQWAYSNSDNKIYFKVAPDTSPTDYVIEAAVRDSGIYSDGKSYITIDGLEIQETNSYGIDLRDGNNILVKNCSVTRTNGGINIYGASNTYNYAEVSNNTIIDSYKQDGIVITTVGHSTITNNMLTDIASDLMSPKLATGIVVSGTPTTISNNTLLRVSGHGIYIAPETDGIVASNSIKQAVMTVTDNGGIYTDGNHSFLNISNNIINTINPNNTGILYPDIGNGIYLDEGANNVSVSNNVIYDISGSGIKMHGVFANGIYNNTIYGASNSAIDLDEISVNQMHDNLIKNNILVATDNSAFNYKGSRNSGSTGFMEILDNNLYYHTNGSNYIEYTKDGSKVDYSLVDWKTFSSMDTNSINLNPLFTSPGSNFTLLYNSPAINAGTNVSLASDYLGNPIVGTPDIGAYEFQAPTAPHTSSGSSVSSRYNNLLAMGNTQAAQELAQQFPNQISNNQIPTPPTQTISIITPAPYTTLTLLRILKLVTPRMWGDDVLALQTLLNTKGYDSGTPDGNFGPKTQSAVIAFQKANGLVPDGSVGSNTLNYLNGNQKITTTTYPAIQPAVTRILKLLIPRMIGDDVKSLQTYLSTNGYDVGNPDGIFGLKTQSAVIAFQTANNLTPDGIVGAKTLEMMK